MSIDISSHRVTHYSSQLRHAGTSSRWREFKFFSKDDTLLMKVVCFMDEKITEDLFHTRLPPSGFDTEGKDEREPSEAPIG